MGKVVRNVREAYPFSVEAWVLLPDHMHSIWRLPRGDTDFSLRWALIKKGFTKGAKDWPHSTFHSFVKKGLYSSDWGATPVVIKPDVGRE